MEEYAGGIFSLTRCRRRQAVTDVGMWRSHNDFPTPAQCAHWAPSPRGEGFGSPRKLPDKQKFKGGLFTNCSVLFAEDVL